jgi:hypothetical protein
VLVMFFILDCMWIITRSRPPGHTLEPPDKKAQDFLISIALKQLFHEHVRKMFGEMTVRA